MTLKKAPSVIGKSSKKITECIIPMHSCTTAKRAQYSTSKISTCSQWRDRWCHDRCADGTTFDTVTITAPHPAITTSRQEALPFSFPVHVTRTRVMMMWSQTHCWTATNVVRHLELNLGAPFICLEWLLKSFHFMTSIHVRRYQFLQLSLISDDRAYWKHLIAEQSVDSVHVWMIKQCTKAEVRAEGDRTSSSLST